MVQVEALDQEPKCMLKTIDSGASGYKDCMMVFRVIVADIQKLYSLEV